MKTVDTTNVAAGAAMKFKSGIFDHINTSITELVRALSISDIGSEYSNAGNCYVLWGCVNTGSGSNYILSEGAIFLGGVVYRVAAVTLNLVGQVPILSAVTSYTTATNADPVSFSDGSTHNVHKDVTYTFVGGTATGSYLEYDYLIPINRAVTINLTANYTAGAGATPIFIRSGAKVVMEGVIVCGASAATGQTITTLPISHRPSANRVVTLLLNDGGGVFRFSALSIATTGVVSVLWSNSTATTGASFASFNIYLDGISYYI